tara:strand:+ start:123 stop:833 length:711 start_codon:yes stop_codon:yes gene_type:complete
VERGLARNLRHAQALILSGNVFSGKTRVIKAGTPIKSDTGLEVRTQDCQWVSRGGLKLEHALTCFDLTLEGSVCLDIGASTGGFTDVLLSQGVARVYAVDVGYGQLHWKLQQNSRVIMLDRQNARMLTEKIIPEKINTVVCDASFIRLSSVLSVPLKLTAPGAQLVALIKPQFEVSKSEVGKGGVVRDPKLHTLVCNRVTEWINNQSVWRVLGVEESPPTGAGKNKEFLIAAKRGN